MQPSLHNIISPIDGGEFLIINILSGNADVISAGEKEILTTAGLSQYPSEFIEKGYITDPAQEELQYRLKYIDFLEQRDKEEMQIFFVPTYHCNFTCSYCYQSEYPKLKHKFTPEVTDAFFQYIKEKFSTRPKYITLFGGEPLMGNTEHRKNIEYFLSSCRKEGLSLAIVTNGYLLDEYIDLLDNSYIREIQVTLDGTYEVHDKRRRLGSNGPTFDTIVRNIDLCLQKNIPINLRMVVDKENINNLPQLASFAIDKGWADNPLFKTQIGRNYELHYCQHGTSLLFDRLSLYSELLNLIKLHPEILRFHKPSFSVMKFLSENGSLPEALFDSCPACKSEWAFDYTGSIYSCTATVGKPGEKLGSFYPEKELNEEKIKVWQQRDVMHIDKCRQCNLQLICGGGCGSIAFNQHGNITAPDCRPIDGLHTLGYKAYNF